MSEKIRSGFVALLGRPNSGKSSLLNFLLGEKIALVSHKANATRKRLNAIVMHKNHQIILVDTPGLHEKERLLNQFMLEEAYKALGDCDLVLFLMPVKDKIDEYLKFLRLNNNKKPHILILTKTDTANNAQILSKMQELNAYNESFLSLIPFSTKKQKNKEYLLDEIVKNIPLHPYFYDIDILTTENEKEIYKEIIREALFANISDEIPYSSDILIKKVISEKNIENIYANIITEKENHKNIIIGKNATAIKRIGSEARKVLENFIQKKVFLKLDVKVEKNWTKDKKIIKMLGYYL